MRKVHFFKAKSRIGLTNPPVRQKEANIGVEEGCEFLLTEQFLLGFEQYQVSQYNFSFPEHIKPDQYISVLVKELEEFKNLINKSLSSDEIQVVLGGDNTISFPSLLAVLERVSDIEDIGYIQFDSHGEMNSFKSSPSGNFHGMYMRPFFEKFDLSEIDQLVALTLALSQRERESLKKNVSGSFSFWEKVRMRVKREKLDFRIKPSQALFFGDLVLDGDEPQFFRKSKFQTINLKQYQNNKSKIQKNLMDFLKKYKHIHINFDIDIFLESVAGATGIPEDGKWGWQEVKELLEIISTHSSISIDLSEINPLRKNSKRTIKVGQRVLEVLLS